MLRIRAAGAGGVGSAVNSGEGGSLGTRLGRAHRAETEVCFSLETFEMFYIGQRVVCIDDKFLGENGVFDPTFAERCPNLPVKGGIYTVRGFVVPYVGYPGQPGMLLEEIVNRPSLYVEGTFEPSFFPSHFRPLAERPTDISIFTRILGNVRSREPV
jgi:hypothetical protein